MSLQHQYEWENTSGIPSGLFYEAIRENGYTCFRSGTQSTETKMESLDLPENPEVVVEYENSDQLVRVLRAQGWVARLETWHSSKFFSITVAGHHDVEKVLTHLLDQLEPIPIRDDGLVPVRFWSLGPHGPVERVRKIRGERWEVLRENYPDPVRKGLDSLMSLHPSEDLDRLGGRIVLLHGFPGTGKSHFLRALAKRWAPFSDSVYIVDPDEFFDRAEYLSKVLFGSEPTGEFVPSDETSLDAVILHGGDRFRMLVIEDADEFIRFDAKQRSGQQLSKLLNTADGFIGDGLKLLVVLTTNEPLTEVHPAVSRPGRCIANVEFEPFGRPEAQEWLRAKGADISLNGTQRYYLSELYDKLREQQQVKLVRETGSVGQYL